MHGYDHELKILSQPQPDYIPLALVAALSRKIPDETRYSAIHQIKGRFPSLTCIFLVMLSRYYEGPKPIIVTSDVELLQQVMIKEFSKFHSRKVILAYQMI